MAQGLRGAARAASITAARGSGALVMNKKDSAFLAAVSALAGYFVGQASSPDQTTAGPPARPSLVRDRGGPEDRPPSVRRAGVGGIQRSDLTQP